MSDKAETTAAVGGAFVALALVFAIWLGLVTLVTYGLWNLVVVGLLGAAPIDWGAAFGIALIVSIIQLIFTR